MTSFHQLPSIKARQVVRVLERAGFIRHHQKGSHLTMKHPSSGLRTVVPIHAGETIGKGLLMEIIDQAGLTIDTFLELL